MKYKCLITLGPTDASVEDRSVVGFHGYAVGSDGSVWSCRRVGRPYGFEALWHQLKPGFTDGYPIVSLVTDSGTNRMRRVNRLILEAFVGPCPVGQECCHYDGNQGNNWLSNLRWGTRKDNCADRRRHGKDKQWDKRKLTDADAAQIRTLRAEGWTLRKLAEKFGMAVRPIRAIVIGETYRE